MAISKQQLEVSNYDNPHWPNRVPDAKLLRLVYGAEADELVVLFDAVRHHQPAFVFIATPDDYGYAAVKVDGATGDIVGILVYPLAAYAANRHPAWRAATKPNPDPSVAARIVCDIKELFDRYGIETGSDE